MARMHLLSLNCDVLLEILAYLTASDALHLALTSREALTAASPQLLYDVQLSKVGDIPGLLSFLFAEPTTRILHLKNITISMMAAHFLATDTPSAQQSLKQLAVVFRTAIQLKSIHLYKAEQILRNSQELMDALIPLSNLHVLLFRDAGRRVAKLLSAIASRPRQITLKHYYNVDEKSRDALVTADDFMRLTSPSMQKLDILHLYNCTALFSNPHDNIICTHVHTLQLDELEFNLPVFSAAFPNIRKLFIGSGCTPLSSEGKQAKWEHLDHLTTCMPISLSRPVRRLRMTQRLIAAGPRYAIDTVSPFLLRASPTVLELALIFSGKASPQTNTKLICDATPNVRYLDLVILDRSRDIDNEDLTEFMGDRTGSLAGLWSDVSQTELWLWSRIAGWTGSSLIGLSVRHILEHRPQEDDQARLEIVAIIIATFLPRLEYVGICLEEPNFSRKCYDLSRKWFRVKRTGLQNPELEELCAEVGVDIQRELWEMQPN